MTDIQIPTINYTNGQISNCIIKIDSHSFNVKFVEGNYQVSKESDVETPSEVITPPASTQAVKSPKSTVLSKENKNTPTVLSKKKPVDKPVDTPVDKVDKPVDKPVNKPATDIDTLAAEINNFMNV